MGKDKLKRFDENLRLKTMVQPKLSWPPQDHELKGKWAEKFFGNSNPITLELGCGRGEYTIGLARLFPERNFIGVDWKGARLWRGAKTAAEENFPNAGFLRIQIQNITSLFTDPEVNEIWITFPDPQMQTPRERKRLTSPRFLDLYRKILVPGGIVHLKTDSSMLHDYTLEVINAQGLEVVQQTKDLYSNVKDDSVLSIRTTYEALALKAGLKICYLSFRLR